MACGKQPAGRRGVGSAERIDPQTGHRSALPRYARFRVETACPIVGADSSARPNSLGECRQIASLIDSAVRSACSFS